MLDFQDRSIKKYVANHLCYLVVIETDALNPNLLQVCIYEDTVASLGGRIIKRLWGINGLLEAKNRAESALNIILNQEKTCEKD